MGTERPEHAKSGRVSPTAPDFASASHRAWGDALSDEETRDALDRGLREVEEGKTKPWDEVRSRVKRS